MAPFIFRLVKRRRLRRARRRTAPSRQYLAHKEEARAFATERLTHFNALYGYTYHRISIRNQKTRWGSCSRSGNLNFNYRIVLIPPHLADYIIVHELCHLAEMNHSASFWKLVEKTIPDHSACRNELRKISLRGR